MSFYYFLAGLPSKLANQDYNIRFLCTSNIAGALELADGLVDEFKLDLIFFTVPWPVTLLWCTETTRSIQCSGRKRVSELWLGDSEVLVIPPVLCHLGDAPMHAEITNTPNPSTSLNPCRMFQLSVQKKAEKQTETYIREFLLLDSLGNRVCHEGIRKMCLLIRQVSY